MSKEIAAKPLTAKQVFKNVKPVESKNVEVYFDKAFKVNPKSKFDGYSDKLGGYLGAFVRVGDNPDIFAVPYKITAAKTSAGESSLRGAFKTRGIATVSIEELKPKKK